MTTTVGIPRGLMYYDYGPAMHAFLESCGARVIVSPATNREILETGLALCVDDACLPVKAFFGHAAALADRVDVLFIPRFVSVERGAYICPKLMGLPDMIRARLRNAPAVVDTSVDAYRGVHRCFSSMSQGDARDILGIGPQRLAWALGNALMAHARDERQRNPRSAPALPEAGRPDVQDHGDRPGSIYERVLTIGVLGHSYNLEDPYLSLNLVSRLERMGVTAVTADDYAYRELERWERRRRGRKRVFWTTGRKLIGAAQRWRTTGEVDGMIHLTSFGCGPESFVAEVIAQDATRHGDIPFMVLNVDEHSGEAGMATRLEAFVDTVRMRKSER
jgi:predicted nucleotide-binding protein (sugar kinase/HSP70/actin superfamily)